MTILSDALSLAQTFDVTGADTRSRTLIRELERYIPNDPYQNATLGDDNRFWFAALKAMGVITGTDPAFEAAPAGQYTVTPRGELENYPSNITIEMLLREASLGESQDWMFELGEDLGFGVQELTVYPDPVPPI